MDESGWTASDWIALGALVIAALSFLATLVERAVRRRDMDQERKDRREELDLLRRQVEGEAEHRLRERTAELICRQGSRGGMTPDLDEYNIALLNGGKAIAHDVQAWIADYDGKVLSPNPQALGSIPPDAKPIEFKLHLPHDISRDATTQIFLRAAWTDGTGDHEENIWGLNKV